MKTESKRSRNTSQSVVLGMRRTPTRLTSIALTYCTSALAAGKERMKAFHVTVRAQRSGQLSRGGGGGGGGVGGGVGPRGAPSLFFGGQVSGGETLKGGSRGSLWGDF